jgi:hypothetical protein
MPPTTVKQNSLSASFFNEGALRILQREVDTFETEDVALLEDDIAGKSPRRPRFTPKKEPIPIRSHSKARRYVIDQSATAQSLCFAF